MNHPHSPFLVIPVDKKSWTESVLYVLFGNGHLRPYLATKAYVVMNEEFSVYDWLL